MVSKELLHFLISMMYMNRVAHRIPDYSFNLDGLSSFVPTFILISIFCITIFFFLMCVSHQKFLTDIELFFQRMIFFGCIHVLYFSVFKLSDFSSHPLPLFVLVTFECIEFKLSYYFIIVLIIFLCYNTDI